jgi:TPR repeat protein
VGVNIWWGRINSTVNVVGYTTAADRGDADAQNNLGVLLYNLHFKGGHDKSGEKYTLADRIFIDCLKEAAENGSALGQYNYGLVNYYGLGGVDVNKQKAFHWFQKASENKNKNNRNGYVDYHLGMIYQEGLGTAERKDFIKALDHYTKSADMNCTHSYISIGDMYKYGHGGIKRDPEQVFKWYMESAKIGDPIGKLEMGILHLTGLDDGVVVESMIWR